MSAAHEERFIQLETKIAYQERLLEELNDVLIAKVNLLDELQKRLKTLEDLVRSEGPLAAMPHERPPHY